MGLLSIIPGNPVTLFIKPLMKAGSRCVVVRASQSPPPPLPPSPRLPSLFPQLPHLSAVSTPPSLPPLPLPRPRFRLFEILKKLLAPKFARALQSKLAFSDEKRLAIEDAIIKCVGRWWA